MCAVFARGKCNFCTVIMQFLHTVKEKTAIGSVQNQAKKRQECAKPGKNLRGSVQNRVKNRGGSVQNCAKI